MRQLLSFLTRNRGRAPRPLPTPAPGYDLDAALAAKRAGRAERNARARRGAATKVRQAYVADPLRNEQVRF